MSFDAGALIYKIQALGAQQAQSDLRALDAQFRRTGQGAAESKPKVEDLGKATDGTARKARDAKKPLDEQAKATEDVGRKSKKTEEEQRKQTQATEAQVQAAKTLSLALVAVGAAAGAMVALSVARQTEFGAAMSNTAAATMANAEEQKALGEAALEAGADTKYSATEAAAAEEELAKAGLTVTEVIRGGLNGALSLAAAGQLQVARSAEIMATTLKQFKLPAEQAAHVSDVLAAGAGKAQGSVEDMSLALSYVGPVAAGLKLSLEETGGSIAYLASQGILGEKAGTSLRGVLMSLTAPSQIAAKEMEKYRIEVFDAQGKMKSLSEIAAILKDRLGGLTEAERSAALGRIFGNEQITAARLLYQGGAEAIDEWTTKVNDSGYAAEQAAMRQDNLAGDIEKLGGAFDTALIKTGSGANDVLREMTQIVTSLVDSYGEMPDPVQQGALAFGVLTAAILLTSGAAIGLTARFSELRVQMERNNISMGKTALLGGVVGLALAGVLTAVAVLAQKQAEARERAEAYNDALKQGADAARKFVAEQLTAEQSHLWISRGSAADAAEKFGLSLETVADAAEGNKTALKEMADIIKAGQGDTDAAFRLMDKYGLTMVEVSQASTVLAEGVENVTRARKDGARIEEQQQEIATESVEVSKTATEAYLDEASSIDDLNSQLQELIDRINEANGIGQDAVSTNAAYQESIAGISEEVQRQKDKFLEPQKRAYEELNGTLDGFVGNLDGFSLSLDQTTVAGSANAAMLADVAGKAQTAAEAQFEVDKQTMSGKDAADKYFGTLVAQKKAFEDSAVAAGYNADEVKALSDQVFQLPSEKEIEILADTAQATTALNQFIEDASKKVIRIGVTTVRKDGNVPGGVTYQDYPGGPIRYEDGGIRVRAFANGSEHHVAQIARAGEYRLWAEDETGGEAYIPLADAKRARSTAILGDVATRFGYQLVPVGSSRHADGSVTPGLASAPGRSPISATFVMPPGLDPNSTIRAGLFQLEDFLRELQP